MPLEAATDRGRAGAVRADGALPGLTGHQLLPLDVVTLRGEKSVDCTAARDSGRLLPSPHVLFEVPAPVRPGAAICLAPEPTRARLSLPVLNRPPLTRSGPVDLLPWDSR
jgi:hypothetical protein